MYKMKRYYLLLLLGGSWYPAIARHQEREVLALLDSISQRNFQATFTYSSRSPQEQPKEIFKGEITVHGNQYHLTTQQQEIINNGQTIWTYLVEANEVQITDYDPEQTAAMPWTIFANYRQDYALGRLDTHRIKGYVCNVVELVPKDDENGLCKIVLTIAHTTKHIQCLEVLDSNQILHTFSVTNFTYDLKLNKSFFNFNLDNYPNIEVIDMR
jgi:outer membrane lipoprotein carrier protein